MQGSITGSHSAIGRWAAGWLWIPALAVLGVYVLLLFPSGRLMSPRWRWVERAAALGVLATCVGTAVNPGLTAPVGDPVSVPGPWGSFVSKAGLLVLVGCIVASVWSLVLRRRRSSTPERLQIRWLAFSGGVLALTLVLAAIEAATGGGGPGGPIVLLAALLTVPSGVAVAILRYRLYDIDRLISRTLSYTLVTGVLVGTYVAVVVLATKVLGFSSPVAVAASTLVAVGLFSPLRRRMQRVVDRRFNRADTTRRRWFLHLRRVCVITSSSTRSARNFSRS